MTWREFKKRVLGFIGATITSRKVWLTLMACYAAWEMGSPEKIPYLLLALMAGIAVEDAAAKVGLPFSFPELTQFKEEEGNEES